jgi:hypothetical protein
VSGKRQWIETQVVAHGYGWHSDTRTSLLRQWSVVAQAAAWSFFFVSHKMNIFCGGHHKIYIFHLRTYVSQDKFLPMKNIFFHQFSFVFHQLKANESLSVFLL